MNPSPHTHRTRADGYATNDTESRMSSGSDTGEGSPTTTTPTEAGSDATNQEYPLVYMRKFSAPNNPDALRLAQNVLNDVDSNDELRFRASLNDVTNTFMESRKRLDVVLEDYIAIRRRFMVTYVRRCKEEQGQRTTENEDDMIKEGNQKAHGGDCLLDAVVLKLPDGPGQDTYTRLYGMPPDKVEEIAHNSIIDELNQHATAVANGRREVSLDYLDAFNKFIAALEKEGITPGTDLNPGVRAAYDALKDTPVYEPNARSSCSKKRKL
ncbi:hypothetical protein ASPVEDRAFT_88537 [Aspergillus versicolor CBS 583.65]|uniref:Uncharacterized protein n=1 Tax=Aspergillus versicolor CBS 583.65 TaxID=1036611 RepID=A0A1L9Q0I3_ASPVE|nr:uncharacterized protein ASPVEDRAFT_88537 [Aspergillus versicolor CBS 583.65]OJJ07284.1 hypothetical protein ASPVEDRAFT_88537 [Aspergillus versicolor CBS 583.65]